MMSYRLWERKEDSFGGLPVERPHGEVVILPLSDSQLFLKILKGIEGVAGIEFFIVLSMTALHFPVVSGGVGLNELRRPITCYAVCPATWPLAISWKCSAMTFPIVLARPSAGSV